MYIIIDYIPMCETNINIMCEDGETAIFDNYEDAEDYAVEYAAWNYKVVKL